LCDDRLPDVLGPSFGTDDSGCDGVAGPLTRLILFPVLDRKSKFASLFPAFNSLFAPPGNMPHKSLI